MNPIGNLSRGPLIRKLRIDPHPISRGPGKLNHLRCRISPQQIFLQLHRIRFSRKRPNLHTPPSTRIRIRPNRRGKRLHLHLRHAGAIDSGRLRRSQREIDNPPSHKRPSVRNLHHRRLIRTQVRHSDHGPHRQCQVSSRHRILVVHRPVGALPSGIRRPIPTRQPNLSRDGFSQAIRQWSRGGNRSSRSCPWGGRPRNSAFRTGIGRRRLISNSRLPVATHSHQSECRQRSCAAIPRPRHGFGASFGGGGVRA